MRRNKIAFIAAVTSLVLMTALLPSTARAQHQQDPLKIPAVYTLANMDKVEVQRDVTYKTVGGATLKMDVYYPQGIKSGDRVPAVIFVNGVGDQPGTPSLKDWGQYSSWGRLVAASGLVGINYQSRASDINADTEDLIKHVRSNGAALKIDENRICLWSCSANVRLGLPLVMDTSRKYISCAVFYYGVMNDAPSRQDVPLFVARAGLDNPNLNNGIDTFIKEAIAEDVPLTLVSYVDGRHGFDLVDNNDKSREVIKQTLDFMKFHLTKKVDAKEIAKRAPTPTRFVAMILRDGWASALKTYQEAKKTDPEAALFEENIINLIGYQLIQSSRSKEAVEVFKLNVEAYPKSSNVYDSLADGYEAEGNKELAIKYSEKALEVLATETGIDEARKKNIRDSAEGKLKRLKGQ